MPLFKKLDYKALLYESLRNYFSVNSSGNISMLFKFCAGCLAPLQAPFENYDKKRIVNELIANCKWQIGQLKNVLNYLYDRTANRIFITQSITIVIADPQFEYHSVLFDSMFGENVQVNERGFYDRASQSSVSINVPLGTDINSLTATLEQIHLQGIPYQIITF